MRNCNKGKISSKYLVFKHLKISAKIKDQTSESPQKKKKKKYDRKFINI